MATAPSCGRLPPSDDEASYSPCIQPISLSELDNRGEMPAVFDENAQFPMSNGSASDQPSCNDHPPNQTAHVIVVSQDSQALPPPSDSPKSLPAHGQTLRSDSNGRPSRLGSPVVLNLDRADSLNLTFPLMHASPIQENFHFSLEQPLVLNRRTRWLSTGRSLAPQSERDWKNKEPNASNSTEVETLCGVHPTKTRLKHNNYSISSLKSTMFSSLNKSEPNLATPPYDCLLSPPPVFDVPSTDQLAVSHATRRHKSQFSLSDVKPQFFEAAEVTRTPNFGNHPTIKALLNQTSKRISQFTSRRAGPHSSTQCQPSAVLLPSDDLPHSPRSPVTSEHLECGTNVPKASTAPHPPTTSELLPCQVHPPAATSRVTPPGELLKPGKQFRRTNARIHSPNFYQSLKSRWKSESVPVLNASGATTKLPPTSDDFPETEPSLEQKQLEQRQCLSHSISAHNCRPTAERPLPLEVAGSLPSRPTAGSIPRDSREDEVGVVESTVVVPQIDPIASSPPFSVQASKSNSTSLPPHQISNNQALTPIRLHQSASKISAEGNPEVTLSNLMTTDAAYQSITRAEITLSPVPTHEVSSLNPQPDTLTEANEMTSKSQAKLPGTHASHSLFHHNNTEILGSSENQYTPTFSPHISRECFNHDPMAHKPSARGLKLPREDQSHANHCVYSTEKRLSFVSHDSPVTHNKPISCPKSRSTSVSRTQRGPGTPARFALHKQRDEVIPDFKLEKMDVIDDLLHKNHLSSASRRSSISMVLKHPDSINVATPLLFQGIWEKELEENERKWKRLARTSGSQPSSLDSDESPSDKDDVIHANNYIKRVNKDCLVRRLSTREPSHSKKTNQSICPPGALPPGIPVQSDVLEKVWDSFKSEAEISLSDINCDGSLVGQTATSFDPLCPSPEAGPLALTSCFEDVEESCAIRKQKPIGLGLFHPGGSPAEANFRSSNDFSPITSPKLKKLSLLSNNPICSSLLGNSRSKKRVNAGKAPSQAVHIPNHESNPSSLDLSLLSSFPVPPCKSQSNQSSSVSFSLRLLKLSDSPRKTPAISVPSPVGQVPAPTSEWSSQGTTRVNQNAPLSASKPLTSKLISFTPTSFSSRPRAQASGRCPIPPPLKLRATSPQINLDHRRRTLTATFNNNGNGCSASVPPVPSFRAPHTAPLQSCTNFEYSNCDRDAEPALSSDLIRPNFSSATVQSKLTTCGLTPKRPSLLVRPHLRSPRMVAWSRPREINLAPDTTSKHIPIIDSPEAGSSSRTTRSVGQTSSTLLAHHPFEQAGCFSSPHTSVGSSTGTPSSGSTVPSPTTPTSSRITYNNRIPPVPAYNPSLRSPSSHSPTQSIHPEYSRYLIIEQTPKRSNAERMAPNTIKASRMYGPDFPRPKPSTELMEKVSYGMAL